MIGVLNQPDYNLPDLKPLRDASTEQVRKALSQSITDSGCAQPDPLLLEGLIAAINRVVVLAYREQATAEKRFERAYTSPIYYSP